jgi:hypothetical protein
MPAWPLTQVSGRTRYPEADHAETAAFVPLSALTVTH